MDLSEAVGKADTQMVDWIIEIASDRDGSNFDISMRSRADDQIGAKLNEDGYGGAAQEVSTKAGAQIGRQAAEGLKEQIDKDEDIREQLVERVGELLSDRVYPIFAVGYTMGAPEHSTKPKTRQTYLNVMRETDRDTLTVLTNRFRSEYAIEELFIHKFHLAGEFVSTLFAKHLMEYTYTNVVNYAALASALVLFEAFLVGLRTRRVLEEDATLEQIAQEFKES